MTSGTLSSHHYLDESIFTKSVGGAEADSPPSLTNSSESPRSLSDHSSPPSSSYTQPDQQHSRQGQEHQQPISHYATSPMGSVASTKSPVDSGSRDDASSQVNGSWHTPAARGSSARSPAAAIDSLMSSSSSSSNGFADGGEPWEQTSTQFDQLGDLTGWGRGLPENLADFDAVPGVDVSREVQHALSRGGGLDAWAANASQSIGQNVWDSRDNDEAMFDSLIQEDSFGPASAATSDHGGDESPQSDSPPLAAQFESLTVPSPNRLPTSSLSFTNQEAHQPMHSQQSSSSSVTMSSSQADAAAARRATALPTNLSSKSDAELPFSATNIVRPPREELRNLQVHIHGIPHSGAKSRVETQIRTRIELVRPAGGAGPSIQQQKIQQQTGGIGSDAWERIASFTHIKLPPLSSTKRKSKKAKGSPDAVPEHTLFVDATVVNATAPHSRVLVCSGCRTRERKRALRKRQAPEIPPSAEEMVKMGIDPKSKGAAERAMSLLEEDEKQRIILFNCGEYVDFADGACVLPTRITCYCRHHQEKIGFCIMFTMRDWQGNIVATGSTPPILITDDHKSAAAHQAAANAAAAAGKTETKAKASSMITPASNGGGPVKQVDGSRTSRSNSTEADAASVAVRARKGSNARKTVRAKPYGDAPDRSARRSTNDSSSGLVMTPYSGTGNNTPAISERPLYSLGLSRNGSMGEAPEASRTPADAASPGSATSRNSVTSPAAWLAAENGSLSPSTLATLPQSMPTFDFQAFLRDTSNGQTGSLIALAEAQQAQQVQFQQQQQQLAAFPSSLPMPPPGFDASVPQQPVPHISKLIPGEGPTSGGIEVTILGENFVDGLVCVFGDVHATNTRVWAANTLVCILPPSCSPGPVVVDIKGVGGAPTPDGRPLQLFTYVDTSDRALMELALQVVGLQMTGQMQSARDVAMRVVGSNGNGAGPSGSATTSGQQPQGYQAQSVARDAVSGLFAAGSASARGESQSFQDSVLGFLSLLDIELSADDLPEGRPLRKDAIRLSNKQGHTLLHLSVMLGFHRLVAALLKRGCPPNARDHNGYTPLHFAASLGRMTIARMLLSHSARDDLPNALGRVPIDVAREKEQLDVEMLLAEQTSAAAHRILQARHTVYGVPEDSGVSLSDRSSEIDADNVSTGFDDSADFSGSSSEDGGDDEEERTPCETPGVVTPQPACTGTSNFPLDVKTHLSDDSVPSVSEKPETKVSDAKTSLTVPSPTSAPSPTARAKAKEAEASSESPPINAAEAASNVNDATYGALRALLAGDFGDFRQKLQLPAVLPAIHDRIMPAIAVFHLALPNGGDLRAWAMRGNSGASSAEGSSRLDKDDTAEDQEPNKLMTMWERLVEDSSLWKSKDTKASPPPSYESVAGRRASFARADAGSSHHLPNIPRPSSRTSHHKTRAMRTAEEMGCAVSPRTPSGGVSLSRSNSGSRHHTVLVSLSVSTSALLTAEQSSSTPSRRSRRSASGAAATSPSSANGTAASRRVRNLRDDAMLLYFWLPALTVVLLVFLYASTHSSDSVLSLADLWSYLPSSLDSTARVAAAAPQHA